MFALENTVLRLTVAEDGSAVALRDRQRGCTWNLLRSRMGYCSQGERRPFGGGRAAPQGEAILLSFDLPQGQVRYWWRLGPDCAEVSLETQVEEVDSISLPGPFWPEEGGWELALPLYQGVLLQEGQGDWERSLGPGGHLQFSMGMGAVLGERGGLLSAQETLAGWRGTFGAESDRLFFHLEECPCPVEGWGRPAVRLYPLAPDLTAVCKQYRRRLVERGEFTPWEEKVERKPILGEFFGSLMAFIGYNQSRETDYAGSARRLKERGFERVLYYPARMCSYSLGFKMGGDDPIWLADEEMARMKAAGGVELSPWTWIYEGLDDGTQAMRARFRHDAAGQPIPHWKIDQFQWYRVCTPYQVEHLAERLAGDMAQMGWLHFDVNASVPGMPCFNQEHGLHQGAPMGRRADLEWTRRLFSPRTVGNRIVSSEGFVDHYASHYDIGSTKMMPAPAGSGTVPVPMTMLVLHDSCAHDWWELHNYNAVPGFPVAELPHRLGCVGSGNPGLKAALDALYGCPPNLFPFGRQYAWVDIAARKSYSFAIRLEDPQVQEAIQCALPVAQLHRRVGRCELVEFAFLSADGRVQTTLFGDGTRVVANLAEEDREVEQYGVLPAWSWRQVAG